MSSSVSPDGIERREDGLFVTLNEPQTYVILDDVPKSSVTRAIDAKGSVYPLTVTYASGQYLLRANLKGAIYPVTFEMATDGSPVFCCIS